MSAPTVSSLCHNVNQELNKIKEWFCSNRLCINLTKTNFQLYAKRSVDVIPSIKISNVNIERATCVKFLGVVVDEQLSFKQHIESVAKKLSVGIGLLYRGREVLNRNQLTLLYNTILLPNLTYCNLIWGINFPSHLDRLKILQKRAARVILGIGYSEPVSHRFQELGIIPITNLVKKRCLIMIYKMKHSLAPTQTQHLLEWKSTTSDTPNVRHSGPLIIPYARTKYRQDSFRIYAPKLFNKLSFSHNININVPISTYKSKVMEALISI